MAGRGHRSESKSGPRIYDAIPVHRKKSRYASSRGSGQGKRVYGVSVMFLTCYNSTFENSLRSHWSQSWSVSRSTYLVFGR